MEMTRTRLFALGLALACLAHAPASAAPGAEAEAPAPRAGAALLAALPPLARPDEAAAAGIRRCTADGRTCISKTHYVADVCRTLETTARAHALDPSFFARLIWRESLFDAAAVSPKGAQGIAQFMPGTAALRGLGDPFNPAEALAASAHYLADLATSFGNIGLAAVAYNGGEARAQRFVERQGGLPAETRNYVLAITGHSAEAWRDAPPGTVDLALAEGSFREACIAKAGSRNLRAFPTEPPLLPWGVVIASHRDRAGAERHVVRLGYRHAAVLRGEAFAYARVRRPGMQRPMFFAQVGRQSRAEAEALCDRLRRSGGDCMVLRN
jgi:hypothetical protein